MMRKHAFHCGPQKGEQILWLRIECSCSRFLTTLFSIYWAKEKKREQHQTQWQQQPSWHIQWPNNQIRLINIEFAWTSRQVLNNDLIGIFKIYHLNQIDRKRLETLFFSPSSCLFSIHLAIGINFLVKYLLRVWTVFKLIMRRRVKVSRIFIHNCSIIQSMRNTRPWLSTHT